MANEGDGPVGGGGDSGSGGGGGYGDIGAILAYLYHWSFGSDGDYTNSPGYGGYNTGPPGSEKPQRDPEYSVEHLDVLKAPPSTGPDAARRSADRPDATGRIDPYGGGAPPTGGLVSFNGRDVDVFTGLPVGNERMNPFTGAPPTDPFADDVARYRAIAPFARSRRSLLSSPYLLAENDVARCDGQRASCMPKTRSDAGDVNQSSAANEMQAELDASYRAIEAFQQGKARIVGSGDVDVQKLAAWAAQMSGSDEYKLAFTVNQLRAHPLEIHRSAVVAGVEHMVVGTAVAGLSLASIYGTAGLASPVAVMGLATGVAQVGSGFALAISGADSTETLRMEGQLDTVFALTSSPMSLMFGTTGLVLSGGDADVMRGFAGAGGIAEGFASVRGDPSKLYAAVIPGVGTKAEKAASALLLRNMSSVASRAASGGEPASRLLLPGNRLQIVNPHFSVPAGADRVQGAISMVSGKFAADPRLVGNYLGDGELRALSDAQAYARLGDWGDLERVAPTLYGKAVERALDRSSAGSGLLSHTGQMRGPSGRFISSPDWKGLGPFSGQYFESTTAAQLDVHMARGYPSTTVFMTYDIPVSWYFFLTP